MASSLVNRLETERAMDAISNMNTPFYSAQFSRNLLTTSSLNTCYADIGTFRRKLVLDGSLSMELDPHCNTSDRGIPRPSIHALLHNPEKVRDIHLKYIEAGANIITTANFSCVPHFLEGIDYAINSSPATVGAKSSDIASLSKYLVELSGQLARSAKEQAIKSGAPPDSIRVAGCLPPVYDSSLLYKKNQIMSEDNQSRLIHSIVDQLDPYVDLYLCESLVCIQQAELAASIAMQTGKPVWVSWKLNDTPYTVPLLFSCETLAQGVDRLLNSLPNFVDAYLFNCSSPTIISASLPLLRRITRRPIGAYARLPLTITEEAHPFVCTTNPSSSSSTLSSSQLHLHDLQQTSCTQRNIAGDNIDPNIDTVTGQLHPPVNSFLPNAVPQPSSYCVPDITAGDTDTSPTFDSKVVGDDLRSDYTEISNTTRNINGSVATDSISLTQDGASPVSSSSVSSSPTESSTDDSVSMYSPESSYSLSSLVMAVNDTQSPEDYARLAAYWVQCFGADIIGGCCGVGVEHIRQVAIQLRQINEEQEKRFKDKLRRQKGTLGSTQD